MVIESSMPFGNGLEGVPPVKWKADWTRQDARVY